MKVKFNCNICFFLESLMTSREMIPERKNQEKESDDALTVNEETCEEQSQMEDSDGPRAGKEFHSEGAGSPGPVSSGADRHDTDACVRSHPTGTGGALSESSPEQDHKGTEVTDEPMEQD